MSYPIEIDWCIEISPNHWTVVGPSASQRLDMFMMSLHTTNSEVTREKIMTTGTPHMRHMIQGFHEEGSLVTIDKAFTTDGGYSYTAIDKQGNCRKLWKRILSKDNFCDTVNLLETVS